MFNNWHGEDIYVEICKLQLRATTKATNAFDGSSSFSSIYSRSLPFPGASIGQLRTEKGKEKDCVTGTLTGYIQHGSEFSALNTGHNFPEGYGSQAHSPSPSDQQEIGKVIDEHVKPYAAFTLYEEAGDSTWDCRTSRVCDSRIDPLDWCLVSIDQAKAKKVLHLNQHPPSNINEFNSGFRPQALRCFTQERVDAARQYFANGPPFKPISSFPEGLNDVHVYLKPPSATTQKWVVAIRHDTKSITQLGPRGVPSPLVTLITPIDSALSVVSAEGDSGSVVLNRTYNPVGIITSGVPTGQHNRDDLTYVIPIDMVLADIAKENNWEAGSVTFCSG
ncbi:hypothetical protein DL98DRAFT_586711 [Cadophora sp. DSE1049]|nr:hypothetical protein DL98DRAFT_586711 [Cadophora sp. DSE1049]